MLRAKSGAQILIFGSREPALRYYSSSCAPVITGAQLCGVAATIRAGYVEALRQQIQSQADGFRCRIAVWKAAERGLC